MPKESFFYVLKVEVLSLIPVYDLTLSVRVQFSFILWFKPTLDQFLPEMNTKKHSSLINVRHLMHFPDRIISRKSRRSGNVFSFDFPVQLSRVVCIHDRFYLNASLDSTTFKDVFVHIHVNDKYAMLSGNFFRPVCCV